jgi:hypothetical protein
MEVGGVERQRVSGDVKLVDQPGDDRLLDLVEAFGVDAVHGVPKPW